MSDKQATTDQLHGPEEIKALQLLKEVHFLLSIALDSLGGQSYKSMVEGYVWWACVAVNRAAGGYLHLREAGRTDSSKLLVRPALEPVFAAEAVAKKRGFWFRKAYTESLEDEKLVAKDPAATAMVRRHMDDLKAQLQKFDSTYPIECKRVDGRYTAEVAGLVDVYDAAYRLYCQYTHGAFRALEGGLNQVTDEIDTATVSWCVLRMLDLLKLHSPAQVPDLIPFKRRLPTSLPQ